MTILKGRVFIITSVFFALFFSGCSLGQSSDGFFDNCPPGKWRSVEVPTVAAEGTANLADSCPHNLSCSEETRLENASALAVTIARGKMCDEIEVWITTDRIARNGRLVRDQVHTVCSEIIRNGEVCRRVDGDVVRVRVIGEYIER